MLVNEDKGKRVIMFDPNTGKWNPTVEGWTLASIDASMGFVYVERDTGKPAFKYPIKFVRVIDTP